MIKVSEVILGVRRKVADENSKKWKEDRDFLPKIGRGLVAIFRKRPDAFCIDDDTLPLAQPAAPTSTADELAIRMEYQEALELYTAWQCWGEKGSDKQIAAKADSVYNQFLAEVQG